MQLTKTLFSLLYHTGLPLFSKPGAVLTSRLFSSHSRATTLPTMAACTWTPSVQYNTTKSSPIFKSRVSLLSFKKFTTSLPRFTISAKSSKTPPPSSTEEEDDDFTEEDDEDIDVDDFEEENEEENYGMEISTGGTDWGQSILEAVQHLLSTDETLEIYSFRVSPRSKRVDIRLDKLTNKYGSPSLDEVGKFSRDLNVELEKNLGEEKAGEIEIEVSSPGAERLVRVPEEFERFGEMPMLVEYNGREGDVEERKKTVLQFQEYIENGDGGDENGNGKGVSKWTLADVRVNRSGKGRVLNKKQRETVIEIPIKDIYQVNLHVDI